MDEQRRKTLHEIHWSWDPAANDLLRIRRDDLQSLLADSARAERLEGLTHELASRVDDLLAIIENPEANAYDGATTRAAARNALERYRAAAPEGEQS